jgi:hypothetical protein
LFLKFGPPQRLPTSPLRCSQRAGSLATIILPSATKVNPVVTINPHKEEGNKNFPGLHNNHWEFPGDT